MTNQAPRALAGNFAPGFFVKHLLKDIRIALEAADEAGLATPGLETAKRAYERVAAMGWSDNGTQAIFRLYAESSPAREPSSGSAG
jgi:3-hydroxyisobutyrate dehydrogenase